MGVIEGRTWLEIESYPKMFPVEPSAVGPKVHWMRIRPQRVTGRRIVPDK